LTKSPVMLASGRSFDARKADAEVVRETAKEERRSQVEKAEGRARRGGTSRKTERARGARLQATLHAEGHREARVHGRR
jgi:hypothetical protein